MSEKAGGKTEENKKISLFKYSWSYFTFGWNAHLSLKSFKTKRFSFVNKVPKRFKCLCNDAVNLWRKGFDVIMRILNVAMQIIENGKFLSKRKILWTTSRKFTWYLTVQKSEGPLFYYARTPGYLVITSSERVNARLGQKFNRILVLERC